MATMTNLYAHPSLTTSPELIWALQDRLGLRAVVEGRHVSGLVVRLGWA